VTFFRDFGIPTAVPSASVRGRVLMARHHARRIVVRRWEIKVASIAASGVQMIRCGLGVDLTKIYSRRKRIKVDQAMQEWFYVDAEKSFDGC